MPRGLGRAAEPTRHGQGDARLVDHLEPLEIERLTQRVVVEPRVLEPLRTTLRTQRAGRASARAHFIRARVCSGDMGLGSEERSRGFGTCRRT
jgi:hypothetical protein